MSYEKGHAPEDAPVVYDRTPRTLHFFDVLRPTFGERPGAEIIATGVPLTYARQICHAFHLTKLAEEARALFSDEGSVGDVYPIRAWIARFDATKGGGHGG